MKQSFGHMLLAGLVLAASAGLAQAETLMVQGMDQDVSKGSVTAAKVVAAEDGWLVIHRTADGMKPGPVIGHAWLKKGDNMNVQAKLSEKVGKGDKLMLMLHSEAGGMKPGVFEYTLGAKEDGPVKVDGKLVMAVITAK